MKSKFDLKHNLAKLKPENLDDLWLLKEIIVPGVFVTAKTVRSVEIPREDRLEKVGRRPVILKIIVEKVDFDGQRLRLTGKIAEAPEDFEKGYHTIEIKSGSILKVEKTWKAWEVNRIKAAAKTVESIFVCVLDERECDFYVVGERVEHITHLSSPGLGKREGEPKRAEYYGNILSFISDKTEKFRKIIIAGPGFTRQDIIDFISEREKELLEKIITDGLSHTGEVGLQELLRRGVLDRIIKDSRISEETEMVEKLLIEIAREGKAVYGFENTKIAVESGAVETLLVSDKKVREFEELLEEADKTKTRVMIISSQHPSGERLLGLGGIGGLLRYKINY